MVEEKPTSLCYNVWKLGWVTDEDYSDDVDASEMWPSWMRSVYYSISDTMVKYAYTYTLFYYWFFGMSFCYIHAINGLQAVMEKRAEAWKMVFWGPFILGLIPSFLMGLILDKGFKNDG